MCERKWVPSRTTHGGVFWSDRHRQDDIFCHHCFMTWRRLSVRWGKDRRCGYLSLFMVGDLCHQLFVGKTDFFLYPCLICFPVLTCFFQNLLNTPEGSTQASMTFDQLAKWVSSSWYLCVLWVHRYVFFRANTYTMTHNQGEPMTDIWNWHAFALRILA